MSQPPKLPEQMSSDGREIWEWAGKLSEHMQRQDKIRELTFKIAKVGTVCGDCDKWMKSRECPAERNVKGRCVGPSCESRKCSSFVENRSAENSRAQWKAELAQLQPTKESK